MGNIHFRSAIDSVRRSPFQALAAVFVLAMTFFVATNLVVLVYSSNNLLKYFETRPQIIAFLKDKVTPEAISALQNKLTSDLRVKDVRYVSKEEALEIYKTATSDNPLLGQLVSPTIFPASLEFSLKDLSHAEDIINEVKKEGIVNDVGFTASLGGEKTLKDVVSRLRDATHYLKVGGVVFVGMLTITSFLVLFLIIGMRMSARKGEIEVLNLIGATSGFIRSPVILEALIYSFSGVLIGWLLGFIAWLYAAPNIISYFGDIQILPKNAVDFGVLFISILAGELLIGLLLAFMGSLVAVSRARKTR
jgi:cell division transport system permease protein